MTDCLSLQGLENRMKHVLREKVVINFFFIYKNENFTINFLLFAFEGRKTCSRT